MHRFNIQAEFPSPRMLSAGEAFSASIRLLKENPLTHTGRDEIRFLTPKKHSTLPFRGRCERLPFIVTSRDGTDYYSSLAPEPFAWITGFKLRQSSECFFHLPLFANQIKWKESKARTMASLFPLPVHKSLFIFFPPSKPILFLLSQAVSVSLVEAHSGYNGGLLIPG